MTGTFGAMTFFIALKLCTTKKLTTIKVYIYIWFLVHIQDASMCASYLKMLF